MAALDGAKLVRYDSNADCVYAWFGGHGVHAYDAAGVECDFWNTGDFADNNASFQSVYDSMSYRMLDIDGLTERAGEYGREQGEAAASWYFDGNTEPETYAAVLKGIEDGDPAVLDTFPSNPLSGEWAGDLTPRELLRKLGCDPDDFPPDYVDDVLREFEHGYDSAVSDVIERDARANAWTKDDGDGRYGLNGVAWYVIERSPDGSQVRAVMVGDDQVHTLDADDLTPLDDLDYCAECGQVGCTGDFRPRDGDDEPDDEPDAEREPAAPTLAAIIVSPFEANDGDADMLRLWAALAGF